MTDNFTPLFLYCMVYNNMEWYNEMEICSRVLLLIRPMSYKDKYLKHFNQLNK